MNSGVNEAIKLKARQDAAKAIRKGDLIRQPCEVCGNPRTDAHHPDYNKPLEVRWLCRTHHRAEHYPVEGRKVSIQVYLKPRLKNKYARLAKKQNRSLANFIEMLITKACADAKPE